MGESQNRKGMVEKMKEKVQMKSTKRLRHRIYILMFILALFLVTLGILFINFNIQKVTVTGSTYYTEEEIKAKIIGKDVLNNSLLLQLKYKLKEQKEISFIQNIDIEVIDRHTINLNVNEKVITGCVEYMSEYVYFDKDGIVLEITNEKKENVPLITGVTYSEMAIDDKLAVDEDEIFDIILNISKLIKKYKVDIAVVKFDLKGNITLTSGKIKILLGKREVYDEQIAELSGILQKSDRLEGELDLTNFKEGQDNFIFKVE